MRNLTERERVFLAWLWESNQQNGWVRPRKIAHAKGVSPLTLRSVLDALAETDEPLVMRQRQFDDEQFQYALFYALTPLGTKFGEFFSRQRSEEKRFLVEAGAKP